MNSTSRPYQNGSPSHQQDKRPITITDADGRVKPIPDGKYFFDTKDRNERLMTAELSRGARQVHAALAPFTMYYRRETALRPDGKPATSHDLSKKTGYDKALVRRYLDELEEKGYGERRCTDGGDLRKGRVLIISWAYPREPKTEKRGRARPLFPGWIPDTWQSLKAYANRCRYKIPENLEIDEDARNLLLEEGGQVARALEEAQERATRFLDSVCAQAPLYKEERTERTFKEQPPPTSQPISEDVAHPESLLEPAGRLAGEVPEDNPQTPSPADEVRSEVKAYLESIPKPGLTPQIVEEVQKHITTPEALEAFKVETMPAKVQGAQTWKYFVAIAQRVALDAPRYAVAKANGGNGHSPPVKSRSQLRAEAYAREVEAKEKARGG